MEIGAFLGTEDKAVVKTFREIGKNLGLAFQIKDDILGIWGKQEETGKPSGNDIRRHKKSFPVVYAMEKTSGFGDDELVTIYRNNSLSENDIHRVLEIFEAVNSQENAQKRVDMYCAEAEEKFQRLGGVQSVKDDMDELIRFIAGRNY